MGIDSARREEPKTGLPPKSDTRKVSQPSGPQNRPACTCSTLPRASARTSPLAVQTWSPLASHR